MCFSCILDYALHLVVFFGLKKINRNLLTGDDRHLSQFLQFLFLTVCFHKIRESDTKQKTTVSMRRTDKEENPERVGDGKHALTYLNLVMMTNPSARWSALTSKHSAALLTSNIFTWDKHWKLTERVKSGLNDLRILNPESLTVWTQTDEVLELKQH